MYKKFFRKVLLLATPLAFILLIINIYIDSGSVVRDRSPEIARIMISGNNAAIKFVPSNWGSLQTAIVKEKIIQNDTLPGDILVFGSSRSSEIDAGLFPKNSFFNCALPGGNILDYIALYGLYKKNNLMPKYLIISIDPWTFHARRPVRINKKIQYIADNSIPLTVNKYLAYDFKSGLDYLEIKQGAFNRSIPPAYSLDNVIDLFSPNYFQINLRSMGSRIVFETNKNKIDSYFVIRTDGSYSLATQSEIDSNRVIESSSRFTGSNPIDFFIAGDTGTVYFKCFKSLLIHLKKEGVVPIVYISPLNPYIFDHVRIDNRTVLEDEIDYFCRLENILLIGSFNPHKYGYHQVSNFFIDEYHPVKSVVVSIFHTHEDALRISGILLQ